MCETIEQGGKRCVAHTRPPYAALMTAMDKAAAKAPLPVMKAAARKKARDTYPAVDGVNPLNVVINHASTKNGAKEVAADIQRAKDANDDATVAWLTKGAKSGAERAAAAKEASDRIKKAKEKAERALTGSRKELKRDPQVLSGKKASMAAEYPGIAERWHPTKNNGILCSEVAPSANGTIWLQCDEGHEWEGGRGNNINAPIKKGKRYYPICPECEGRRPRLFARTQADLQPLVDVLGDDPNAFHALPQALQYAVMEHLNVLRGGQDSLSRQVGLSAISGNLTLKEVMLATNPSGLDGKLDERLDVDEELATITDVDLSTDLIAADVELDKVLAATGVLALVPAESDLANSVTRATNEYLWSQAYENEAEIDAFVAHIRKYKGLSPQRDAAIERFAAEVEAVLGFTLPAGYVSERLDKFGNPKTMVPDLSQRRFALMVRAQRTLANWSTTGAGKTLSSTLAVQAVGARETLIVCPLQVRDEWINEFRNGFPTTTEVIVVDAVEDLSAARPETAEGVNRVWVVNYDKFSGDEDRVTRAMNQLADRIDAVVFDEIHMAKSRIEDTGLRKNAKRKKIDVSKRRLAMKNFRDRAGEANAELVVIGSSATPVVNDLMEAKSIIRLIEGKGAPAFATAPTIRNAANAHNHLASVGVRRVMNYPAALTRDDITITVPDKGQQVFAHVEAIKANTNKATKRTTPAMMERALLAVKMPKVVEIAKRRRDNGEGGTIVYTHYTTGIMGPIHKALAAEGLRVGVYTGGAQTDKERANTLRKFRNGDLDVIIGSRPISTGVDGLQDACNEMVVVSMPETAADDDQLVGRIHRRGQSRNVKVTYLLTEVKIGDDPRARWSWCKGRQNRIRFKRDIANAAVDGILPSGTLSAETNSADKALAALQQMAAATPAAA